MNELNLDAESVTRNKSHGALEHLEHLIKIGWSSDSPLIKRFLTENNISENELAKIITKITETQNKARCIDRN